MWTTACFGKGFDGASKEHDRVTEYLFQRTEYFCPRWGTLHAQHVGEDIALSRRRPKFKGSNKVVTRKTYKNLIISQTPKMKSITAHTWLELTTSTNKERCEICWSPHTDVKSENHFRKQNVDALYTRAIHGHSGGEHFSRIFLVADRRVRPCERAPQYRPRKVRKKHRRERQAASIRNKGPQQVHVTLVNLLDKKTRTNSTPLTSTSSLSTTRSTLSTWKARNKRNLKFDRALNGCVVSFDTIPEDHMKKVIHIRARVKAKTTIDGSVVHVPRKGRWWQRRGARKRTPLCKGSRQRYLP